MSRIVVLGDGQLGKMLKHAGMPLNHDVLPQNLDSESLIAISPNDILTVEREHWPTTAVTDHLEDHASQFANLDAIRVMNDRKTQKATLDHLNISTAPWAPIDQQPATELAQQFGQRFLLKKRSGGYDGRGQMWCTAETIIDAEWQGTSIAEAAIGFEEEVSLVGMRDATGNVFFYPLATNLHIDGQLMATFADLPKYRSLQSQAEEMLTKLLEHFDYRGVLAMECFVVGEQLLVNELAPRVHNSGHWTQAGAHFSQFEAHLRAVSGTPLSQPKTVGNTLMINLVGVDLDPAWYAVSGSQVWWYGKEVRTARKVGHININADDFSNLADPASTILSTMPKPYDEVLDWVKELLAI